MNAGKPSEDFFARIAAQRLSARGRDLVQPRPPRLVEKLLRPGRSSTLFRLPKTMATAEELQAELARQRAAHARYLRDCAPPLPQTRNRLALEEFSWRIEAPEDTADFGRVLRGEGDWTKVRVPHFGPPIGKAYTFYRTTFEVSPALRGPGRLFLRFDAVDYTAEVFLNGAPVGSHEGFFAPFELDCTRAVRPGSNVLVVRVGNDYVFMGNGEPRREGDKLYAATGPGFDDPREGWHHCPPGMGIYQDVILEARHDLFISDIFVRPLLSEKGAEAWVEVHSCVPDLREVSLELSLFGANFPATLFRGETSHPTVLPVQGSGDVPGKESPASAPLLMGPGANLLRIPFAVRAPKAWTPGNPWLYQLQVRLLDESGAACDSAARCFGMRSFAMSQDSTPRGRLFLNGREIRLRGANTMGFEQQAVMAGDTARLIDDILLAKICRMNFLRLTQRPVQHQVYDLCDRLGLMTQTDLPLFAVMRRTRFSEGVRQAGEMERLVRAHPCNIVVSFINEALPNGMNEPHRHLTRPELDTWVEAASRAVLLENPDRVIKPHDGDYDPPGPGLPDNHCYSGWYNGHGVGIGKLHRGWWQPVKKGWHYACGEFGSEGLDPVDLMRRRYPADWLPGSPEGEKQWSPDAIPSAQTGRFHFMWFDTPDSLAGWVESSQRHQAWVTKLMTEAFRRNAAMNGFAIHLFIDAFPSGWMKTLMDTERRPKPAFFAYRDALSPVMVSLRTDRFAVRAGEKIRIEAWVASDRDDPPRGVRLVWQALEGGSLLCGGSAPVKVPRCSSGYVGTISFEAPAVTTRARIAVQAALRDQRGRTVHHNEVLVDLFPRVCPVPARTRTAARARALILGRRDGPAAVLARGLGLACSYHGAPAQCGLMVIDDLSAYARAEDQILRAVRAGGTAVFVELPAGEHSIGGSPVRVRPTGMGDFFFASRATGHPLVAGLEPRDLFLWYDPREDCIMPLLSTTLDAPGWDTIVSTGHVSWTGASVPAQACAEKRLGKGVLRICQLTLAGRLINPAAEELARRLVTRP
jgi:hypothetical protein